MLPMHPSKRIPSRCLFIGCFGISVILLGWAANYYQARSERLLARNEFRAVAERAVFSVRETTRRAQQANVAVASMYENLFPDAETWPFVSIPTYNAIAEPISKTSGLTGISLGVATFLAPEQEEEFNVFQQDYLENNFPNSSRQVRRFPAGDRVRPLQPSIYNISAPVSRMYGPTARSSVMLDLFSIPLFRPIIEKFHGGQSKQNGKKQCGVFSNFHTERFGPSFYYVHPIYPANDETTAAGITISPINWNEVLKTAFRKDVTGIDCVVESSNGDQFSYTIQNGEPFFLGQGDLHRGGFDDFALAGDLYSHNCTGDELRFQVTFYSSSEFQKTHSIFAPMMATLAVVTIMAFTSFLFFMYDCSVQNSLDEKQAVLEAKRNFMRFVSHEVRTPLNTVLMGLTVIQEEIQRLLSGNSSETDVSVPYGAAADILALSDEIHNSADRAVDILNDLLNYDKIESGKLTLEKTKIETWSFVERTFQEFSLPAQHKEIGLTLDFSSLVNGGATPESASDLPVSVLDHKIIGDSVRIAQVIRNLLSNALKFTPNGGSIILKAEHLLDVMEQGGAPYFKQSSKPDESNEEQDFLGVEEGLCCNQSGFLKLTVKDDGIGMSTDQTSKLFGQGVQFNANALQDGKGSGLGLFIAKGIIEQHGGTLKASSDGLGLGSEFVATIPLFRVPNASCDQRSTTSETLQDREPDAEETSNTSTDHLRALVVDDAPMNRKLLTRLLVNRGWICDSAEDGQVAVDIVKGAKVVGQSYDLILMDFEMPVMNGPAAAKEITATGCRSLILGVTGNVLPDDVKFFKQCGASDVVAKPVKVVDIERLWQDHRGKHLVML